MDEFADAQLAHFTSLKIGGHAQRLCAPDNAQQLIELLDKLKQNSQPWHVLGGGSNLLISTSGVSGTVIRLTKLTQMINPEEGVIEAEAGARMPHLARYAASRGLAELEFMVGIPGTVGGGIYMNAGAHGSSVSEVLESAVVFDTGKHELRTMTVNELGLQYRKSALEEDRHVVLSARFRLAPGNPEEIKAKIDANEEYRWKTQPLSWPSAGSTFKNPPVEGIALKGVTSGQPSAGYLLEKAGAKQLRVGNAAVSAVHANFVINMGGATSSDAAELLAKMQDCVHKAFGVVLKPEWKRLGIFSAQENAAWNGGA